MKEPLSNKKCLLDYKFTCPWCNEPTESAVVILPDDVAIQCMNCFKLHNSEDRKDGR